MFEDIKREEVGIQTEAQDIDFDITSELKFYKGEAARLQAEMI